MSFDSLGKWLQIASNFGVIAGLILVGIEINHSSDLVEADLRTNAVGDWVSSDLARYTDDINRTLAKSLSDPENLTIAEMIELDSYYSVYVTMGSRSNIAYKLGFSGYSSDQAARDIAPIFGTRFAQAWWRERKKFYDQDWVELLDPYIAEISPNQELTGYNRLASTLSQ